MVPRATFSCSLVLYDLWGIVRLPQDLNCSFLLKGVQSCWLVFIVCGGPLLILFLFVLGPSRTLNRTTVDEQSQCSKTVEEQSQCSKTVEEQSQCSKTVDYHSSSNDEPDEIGKKQRKQNARRLWIATVALWTSPLMK